MVILFAYCFLQVELKFEELISVVGQNQENLRSKTLRARKESQTQPKYNAKSHPYDPDKNVFALPTMLSKIPRCNIKLNMYN